jgi:hypothetical protein
MSLMKVYLRLILFVVYVTDEGLLRLLLFMVYVINKGVPKLITGRGVCHC